MDLREDSPSTQSLLVSRKLRQLRARNNNCDTTQEEARTSSRYRERDVQRSEALADADIKPT
jgi:hypothetical protein